MLNGCDTVFEIEPDAEFDFMTFASILLTSKIVSLLLTDIFNENFSFRSSNRRWWRLRVASSKNQTVKDSYASWADRSVTIHLQMNECQAFSSIEMIKHTSKLIESH